MMEEIKNLKKVAERIKKAVKGNEKIILYGDSDVDGICSVVILKETIENLGGKISAVYFCNREEEGYGLTKSGLDFLSNLSPALLFTLDLGISNFEEAKIAKKLGFELVIIDHHVILEKLPEASLIVDPKQKGDKYPFKELATAGLVFKLAQVLLKDEFLEENLLELCALATIADRMAQEEENEVFIERGIENLENTLRPGLQALLKTEFVKEAVSEMELATRINSILGAGEPIDHLNETYLLLTITSLKEASLITEKLLKRREVHKRIVQEMVEEIDKRLAEKTTPFIFEGNSWPNFLLGTAASKICQKYDKPTFIFKRGLASPDARFDSETRREAGSKERITGSIRMPEGIDGVKALKSCSKFLLTYGGHPLAAGFSLKEENLENFKNCLKNYFEK